MKAFLFNILLAIAWCSLTASFTEWNFIAGMIVGALVLEGYTLSVADTHYLGAGVRLLRFALYYLKLLVESNVLVTLAVIQPSRLAPRIVRYPVKGMTDVQRTTLANAITLTPGTLTIDVSPDGEWLYVHTMFGKDTDQVRHEIDDLRRHLRDGVFA